jgi:Ca2+-transporting ATPase
VILERCTQIQTNGGPVALDAKQTALIEERSLALAGEGKRVLAVASRVLADADTNKNPADLERQLTLLGLVAMADTPRPEAKEAVAGCERAGIRTVLVTGDHVGTATAIAKEVGIYKVGDRAITGPELAKMDEDELAAIVDHVTVYARLAPDQKLKIVGAWKKRGAVVAMTGDGVNDAPAIKEADIGVAMGQSGTDVAREAADLVITDDNFASIVAGVEEGRAVYANIRRALLCLFAGNLSEVALVGAATALGLPVPLHPTQILWMNLITDGPPALALATEPVSPDEMRRPPRHRGARLLDRATIFNVVYQGFALYLAAMLAVLYFYDGGAGTRELADRRMQTGVFCTVVVSQMLNCFSFRHDSKSIFTVGFRGNLRLLLAITVSIALQVLLVHWTWASPIFHTQILSLEDWRTVFLLSILPVLLVEARKFFLRRRSA